MPWTSELGLYPFGPVNLISFVQCTLVLANAVIAQHNKIEQSMLRTTNRALPGDFRSSAIEALRRGNEDEGWAFAFDVRTGAVVKIGTRHPMEPDPQVFKFGNSVSSRRGGTTPRLLP